MLIRNSKGLAFATVGSEQEHAVLKDITSLQNWTSKMNNRQKVPSVISYARTSEGEAQWGSDISKNAITMVNTKLELQPQETRFEELDLTFHALKNMGFLSFDHVQKSGPDPAYTSKEPRDIITDYLTRISECYRRAGKVGFLEKAITTSVDVVVTVPVVCETLCRCSLEFANIGV